ncbi:hypothetical protein SCACP_13420 [Sporomusa carbonis]|uniref:hypothetical protein n=1 Tax=Sporomusa carbonis TaxID=3076075 RepID=UPI003A64F25E
MDTQALRVIVAFIIGLCIIYITAKIIGDEKKARWFKKRQQTSLFNRRGMLGETLNFGVPRSWQGVAIMVLMYTVIFAIGYVLVFKI